MKWLALVVGTVAATMGISLLVDRLAPSLLAESLPKADRLVIAKSARRLSLYRGQELIKTYPIQLGRNPVGHKQFEGDSRTPEGNYTIDWRNRRSRFHLSLHISYPNAEDRRRAEAVGNSPGGNIMIHGVPNGLGLFGWFFSRRDWTDGCVGVSNVAIEEIWAAVDNGTAVRIEA